MEAIREAIALVTRKRDLSSGESEAAMHDILSGRATQAQIGALLAGLRVKGETAEEILGCARAMRASATPVRPRRVGLVDTCGTGGDMAGTFNISTTAAFVVAGAGVPVAKHGNRSVSSTCGSADLLEALGVVLSLAPEQVARCVDEVGIGFLFAPKLHPAMANAMGARRELGVRTIFNLLGPLTNPAGVSYQLMGVFDPALVEVVAGVMSGLGLERAMVLHGHGGLDELSITGPNLVAEMRSGEVSLSAIDPVDLGMEPTGIDSLRGGAPEENAAISRAVLRGEAGPRRDVVLLNAAAALYVAGAGDSIQEGLRLAADAVDSGRAEEALEGLVTLSQSLGRVEAA